MVVKVMNVRICSAMKERGITKHDSPEGVKLCLHCPFPECELDANEFKFKAKLVRKRETVVLLHEKGINTVDISKIVGLSYGTVHRYIRRMKKQ